MGQNYIRSTAINHQRQPTFFPLGRNTEHGRVGTSQGRTMPTNIIYVFMFISISQCSLNFRTDWGCTHWYTVY